MTGYFLFARRYFWMMAAVALTVATGCRRAPEWRTAQGAAWGTTYSITYRADDDLSDSVVATMRAVELAVSMFEPTSNISRVNAGATDTLTPMTARVFREARRISILTGGYFDPTVAPLVDLWGFGRKKIKGDSAPKGNGAGTPDSAAIADALATVGIAGCTLDEATGVLTRRHPCTQFDFSALAKGYGVDCVAQMLRRNGCRDYMVEIGGEISVSGHNPRNAEWHIQVDRPEPGVAHRRLTVIPVTDCAMATSGNYRNFRKEGGRTVAHTISPLTGYPYAGRTLSATVIVPYPRADADTATPCMTADALATALMAAPADSIGALLHRLPPEVSVMTVMADTTSACGYSVHSRGPAFADK